MLRAPDGRGQDLPRQHRRPHRRRPVRARSDGRAVAGAGRGLRGDADGLRRVRGRGVRDGRAHAARRDRRARVGPDGGGRGADQSRGGRGSRPRPREALGELDGGGRLPRRGRGAVRHGARRGAGARAGRSASPSRSARIRCRCARRGSEGGETREVVAPLSLVVSAFAPCEDARRTLTPQLRTDRGATELVLVDLGRGQNRLGASHPRAGVRADRRPDARPRRSRRAQAVLRARSRRSTQDGLLLAYHDRSDGGLFAAACEMAFAGRCGVTLNLDLLCYDPLAHDVDGNERRPELMRGRDLERVLGALFAEELGALVQVRADDRGVVMRQADGGGPARPGGRDAERAGRGPPGAQRQAGARREARRPAARVVRGVLPDAGAARRPRMRARGVRPDPRCARRGACRAPVVRPGRGRRRAVCDARRAAARRGAARAGRERPGRDGCGVRRAPASRRSTST